jgi:hypothetical protein
MSYPQANVFNLADGSATVGAQAQVVHGGVHTYFIRPGATAKEKYEVGVNYLNGRAPSLALPLIRQAIAEGHDTSEVRFHWLLALLSGRTSRQLSSEDTDQLDALERHSVVYQLDPWSDGIRAVLRLLNSLRSSGTDPAPFIDALDHLHPAQKKLVLQHITVFLRGPQGDQMWRRDIEAAEAGRYAKHRDKRVTFFFHPWPAKARAKQPGPAVVPSADRAKAFAASVIFVLTLLDVGGELVLHASITGILGFLVGCGGACLAATSWIEFRWRAQRREEARRLFVPAPRTAAPAGGFASRVDQRFNYYSWKYAPDKENRSSWLSPTEGIRNQLRDEIVEIYREERVKAERLNWLIRYEVGQLARRWKEGTLYSAPDDEFHVKPVALWAGMAATALGGLLVVATLLGADPVGGFIALAILAVSGYQAIHRWTGIALELRRAAAEKAASERKYSEREAAYEAWREKLRAIRPTDLEMAEWLECDKKVILKRALRHYGLNRSDVVSYAFLETPTTPYDRASVRNGPWRYTRYKIIVFLLTADGIRQVAYELNTRGGDIEQRDWRSYRYDALASIEASVAKDGHRQEFKLHLVNGQVIPFRVSEPITEWNPDDGNAEAVSSATEDATGLRNTLRILEGVAADGKGWIARETQ